MARRRQPPVWAIASLSSGLDARGLSDNCETPPMSDPTQVSGPVEVRAGSRERVAYDLMSRIAGHEAKEQHPKTREYWLKLYAQCYEVTGGNYKHALEIK